MIRVVNQCEKSIRAIPAKLVVLAANVTGDILPDQTTSDGAAAVKELAGRYIQNVGANPLFYCIGEDCVVGGDYHGILSSLQQLDCSNHCMRISAYSVAGTSVAPTILRRADLEQHVGILKQGFIA